MNAMEDFVFTQIYKGAIRENVSERLAHNTATLGVEDYKKGRYQGRPAKMIQDRIAQAKKAHKDGGRT